MSFERRPYIPILMPEYVRGRWFTALFSKKHRSRASYGTFRREKFWYFAHPIERYAIAFRRATRYLRLFEIIGAIVFAVGFIVMAVAVTVNRGVSPFEASFFRDASFRTNPVPVLIIFGIYALLYLYYILRSTGGRMQSVESRGFEDFIREEVDAEAVHGAAVHDLSAAQRVDIAASFTPDTLRVIDEAYRTADRLGAEKMTTAHLCHALLSDRRVEHIFLRMHIPPKRFRARIVQLFPKDTVDPGTAPTLSSAVLSAIFSAYERAYELRQEYVNVTELLETVIWYDEQLQELLYDLEIDERKFTNVVTWIRLQVKGSAEYAMFRRAASKINKYGIDRAMTAIATPFLNRFSQDLTIVGKMGALTTCVARDREIDELFRLVESGKRGLILVGEHGVGKMTVIEGMVTRIIEESAPDRLIDKRFVELSVSSLLAGTTVAGAQERLIRIFSEVRRAKNIILCINNIEHLIQGSGEAGEGLDVSDALAELLSNTNVVLFATATTRAYQEKIVRGRLGSLLTKVDIVEMNDDQSIRVLESRAGIEEYRQKVFFSYSAIETAVTLARKFLHDQVLPESALGLMAEAASYAKGKSQNTTIVIGEDVASVVSQRVGVPKTSISEDESEKLLRLEQVMHERIVGQDEAVSSVANALRRARAEVRSEKRPIATFLFVGPTGVGKTELAKTIADIYFGGEDRMIRFDMSEYQDTQSIYRLIGAPNEQGTGLLTEAVRQDPFSLVLLDELEKADAGILNLFLQVFDDGRLTDSVGRVVDFTNTVIIATSNAGTNFIQQEIERGVSLITIKDTLIRGELKRSYRPEFLNRFDDIVLFRALSRTDVIEIAKLLLANVATRLEERGVSLRYTDGALLALADVGFDPEFGARPMRRAIQERVENQLAEFIIAGSLSRRDTVVIDDQLKLRIE